MFWSHKNLSQISCFARTKRIIKTLTMFNDPVNNAGHITNFRSRRTTLQITCYEVLSEFVSLFC